MMMLNSKAQALSKDRRLLALYLGRVNSLRRRCGDALPCEYGHYGCAAKEDGPCSNEVEVLLHPDPDDDYWQS